MREVDQARNDFAAAESDLATAQGTLTAARNRLRVIVGRDQGEVDRLERERVVNPLITINAPIDGTVIGRKVGPGQYVRSDAGEPLYSIADLSTMWLKANVPESEIVLCARRPGDRGAASPRCRTACSRRASPRSALPRIRRPGASSVRSEIPNPDRVLKSEMFATLQDRHRRAGEPCAAVPVDVGDPRRRCRRASGCEREPMVFQRRKVQARPRARRPRAGPRRPRCRANRSSGAAPSSSTTNCDS